MLAKPAPAHLAWQKMEIGMFVHFMPTVWVKQGHLYDLSRINPDKLDTDQWVDVAQSMGAKYIVFVAKHGPGFCYWQTDTTPYSMKQLAWRNGKGDVMADLSESCRKAGMKLGLYLAPWDAYWGAGEGGVVGGNSAPVEYKRIRGADLSVTPEAQAHYNDVYRRQLTELLTRYGPIMELWFDGGVKIPIMDLVQEHAPDTVVFNAPPDCANPVIRWCGNEEGLAGDPLWNARDSFIVANEYPENPEYAGDPRGKHWIPVECDTTLRFGPPGYHPKWAWEPNQDHLVRTVDQLMDVYYKTVGRGAVLLLNAAPDPAGLIPESDVLGAAAFGGEIRRRFGQALAMTAGSGEVLELCLKQPARVGHVVTKEDVSRGQRVLEYLVEGRARDGWIPLCRGSSIGYKRIDPFKPAEVSALRLRILRSLDGPVIEQFAAYA